MATASPVTLETPKNGGAQSIWLHGPASDLLLGSGALYILFFIGLGFYGPEIRHAQAPYLLALLVLLVSMPHYGATLVRVYEARRDRRAYAVFSVWISLALFALFVAGVHWAIVGSVLLTVYLTWSPWHYTGQNYGIAVMFLRRRGIAVEPATKRWFYTSFILSYVLVLCAFHGDAGGAVSYDRFSLDQANIAFLPLGFPNEYARVVWVIAATAYVCATLVSVGLLLRRGSLRSLMPALFLMVSQALWFSLPFSFAFWQIQSGVEPIDAQSRVTDYVLYVALAHATQYLWVTSYYARATPRWRGGVRYGGKVLAAGIAIWTLPVILFAPDLLGSATYDTGLALVLAAAINIHHFILDGAIWKLRNTRIGGVLIRSGPETTDTSPERSSRGLRAVVWGLCAAGALVAALMFVEMEIRFDRIYAKSDWQGVENILDRARWFGRDKAGTRRRIARQMFSAGDTQGAIDNYRRAIALTPNASYFGELGFVQQQTGDLDAAVALYLEGLELQPDHPILLLHLGRAQLENGQPDAAVQTFERLSQIKRTSRPGSY